MTEQDQTPRRRGGAHRAERPKRPRALMVAGVGLTCAGVVLVGVTQLRDKAQAKAEAAQDKHSVVEFKQTVQEIQESWARGLKHGEVGLLRIPRFDKPGTPYVAPIVEGWGDDDLARGVGLYTKGAQPGDTGNVVLAGHRITHGSTFADFPSLKVGDKVEVETATSVITYRLTTSGTKYRVDDTTAWPTWSVPDPKGSASASTSKHFLTLVTCAETFHTDYRNVALAVEVSSRPVRHETATASSDLKPRTSSQ